MKNVNGTFVYEAGDKFTVLRPLSIAMEHKAQGETVEVGSKLTASDARYLVGIHKLEYQETKKGK